MRAISRSLAVLVVALASAAHAQGAPPPLQLNLGGTANDRSGAPIQTLFRQVQGGINGMLSARGSANGFAALDANGLLPTTQLPPISLNLPNGGSLSALTLTGFNSPANPTLSPNGMIYNQINTALPGVVTGLGQNIKGSGNSTDIVVGAQINGYSMNTVNTRPVFGIATEAWTGDATTAPNVGAVLIGIEPSVISQRHDQNSALVGVDIPFKNRPDGATAPKQGLGSNQYNKNGRAIQISAQPRSTAGEYSGWPTGILFTSGALDRSVDGLAVGIDMSQLDYTRMLSAIRMPASGALTWDMDQRSLQVLNGSFVYTALGKTAFAADSSGNLSVPVGAAFTTPGGPVFTAAAGGLLSNALVRTADPTTTDIPSGQCADWINSTASTFRHWCNYQGTLRSTTMQ